MNVCTNNLVWWKLSLMQRKVDAMFFKWICGLYDIPNQSINKHMCYVLLMHLKSFLIFWNLNFVRFYFKGPFTGFCFEFLVSPLFLCRSKYRGCPSGDRNRIRGDINMTRGDRDRIIGDIEMIRQTEADMIRGHRDINRGDMESFSGDRNRISGDMTVIRADSNMIRFDRIR